MVFPLKQLLRQAVESLCSSNRLSQLLRWDDDALRIVSQRSNPHLKQGAPVLERFLSCMEGLDGTSLHASAGKSSGLYSEHSST